VCGSAVEEGRYGRGRDDQADLFGDRLTCDGCVEDEAGKFDCAAPDDEVLPVRHDRTARGLTPRVAEQGSGIDRRLGGPLRSCRREAGTRPACERQSHLALRRKCGHHLTIG
jgi:hypothetical protein